MDHYSRPQDLVSIDQGRRLNLHILGENEGAPTVVLAAGFAGVTLDWALVQPRIAKFARVVSFDHAGLGFSDPGPSPRNSEAIVSDLRAALAAVQIGPPYVLVGHSAGGVHMRRFAANHPVEVAGLVLLDSVTDDVIQRVGDLNLPQQRVIWRRLQAMSEAKTLTPDTAEYREHVDFSHPGLPASVNASIRAMRTRPSYYQTLIEESEALCRLTETSSPDVPLASLPLTVLSAGRAEQSPFLQAPGQAAAWREMQGVLASLSSRGAQRELDSGHNIPIERPHDVKEAVRELVEQAR